MQQFEVAFNRLASAWSLPSAGGFGESGLCAREAAPCAPTVLECRGDQPSAAVQELVAANQAATLKVMITRGMQQPPAAFDCGRLASPRVAGRAYRIESVMVGGLDELERHCRVQAPRVLLADIGLICSAGSGAQQLRRRLPATDWIVACDTPLGGACECDKAVLRQARGCISWADSSEHLALALDTVLEGQLWFTRSVLQALYLSLLKAGESAGGTMPTNGCAGELTSREAEVFALMRRGLTNRQIAERLGISSNTVKKHLGHVFEKRGLHGRRQEFG